jgi:hypothetical protein
MIGTRNLKPSQQVRINTVLSIPQRSARPRVNGPKPHLLHDSLNPLPVNNESFMPQDSRDLPVSVTGMLQIHLIDMVTEICVL